MKKGRMVAISLLVSAIAIGGLYFQPKQLKDYEKITLETPKNISYSHSISIHFDSFDNDKSNKETIKEIDNSMLNLSGIIEDGKFNKKYQLVVNNKDFLWERVNNDNCLIITNPGIYKQVSKGKVSEEEYLNTRIYSSILKSVNEKGYEIKHTQNEILKYNRDNTIQIVNENKKVHDLLTGIVKEYVDSKEFHNFMTENYLIKSKLQDSFKNDEEIQKDGELSFEKVKSLNKIVDLININSSKMNLHFKDNQLVDVSLEAICEYNASNTPIKFKILLNSNFYDKDKSQVPKVDVSNSNIIELSKVTKDDLDVFKK